MISQAYLVLNLINLSSDHLGPSQIIGKGSFGKVYMGLNKRTGEMIAVKQVQV